VLLIGHSLSFSITLNEVLLVKFNEVCNLESNITLSHERDQFIIWRLIRNGKFSTHEVYWWLMFRDITNNTADLWWDLSIPLKIKAFMWSIMHNKILTRDNLSRKGWLDDTTCTMCSEQELISHLFFTCHIAKQYG
jgi:zinc-binding in reverse transcriptase